MDFVLCCWCKDLSCTWYMVCGTSPMYYTTSFIQGTVVYYRFAVPYYLFGFTSASDVKAANYTYRTYTSAIDKQ